MEICPDCKSGQNNCVETKPKCNKQGECTGEKNELNEISDTSEDCLKLCKSTSTCNWFTFYKQFSKCVLFKSCYKIDSTCQACVSGERSCSGNCFSECFVMSPREKTTDISSLILIYF